MGVSDNVSVIKCPYMGVCIFPPTPYPPPHPASGDPRNVPKNMQNQYAPDVVRATPISRRQSHEKARLNFCITQPVILCIYYPRFKRTISELCLWELFLLPEHAFFVSFCLSELKLFGSPLISGSAINCLYSCCIQTSGYLAACFWEEMDFWRGEGEEANNPWYWKTTQ